MGSKRWSPQCARLSVLTETTGHSSILLKEDDTISWVSGNCCVAGADFFCGESKSANGSRLSREEEPTSSEFTSSVPIRGLWCCSGGQEEVGRGEEGWGGAFRAGLVVLELNLSSVCENLLLRVPFPVPCCSVACSSGGIHVPLCLIRISSLGEVEEEEGVVEVERVVSSCRRSGSGQRAGVADEGMVGWDTGTLDPSSSWFPRC